MKILLTGGSSTLAQALGPALSIAGHEVITSGRTGCDVYLDLSDSAEPASLPDGMDTVVHMAAHAGGADARSIIAAEQINVLGTLKVCEAAVRLGVTHFVLVSSIFAYLDEHSPFFGIYALSKRHAEEAARLLCATAALPLLVLQPSRIYGTESCRTHQPFLYSMLDKAQRGEDITLFGSNDPVRNYIHIDDLVAVMAKAIDERIEGTFSCQSEKDTSYAQIARAAFAAFGTDGKVHFLPGRPDIPDSVFIQDQRLYERIGIKPDISIEDGIGLLAASRKTVR